MDTINHYDVLARAANGTEPEDAIYAKPLLAWFARSERVRELIRIDEASKETMRYDLPSFKGNPFNDYTSRRERLGLPSIWWEIGMRFAVWGGAIAFMYGIVALTSYILSL